MIPLRRIHQVVFVLALGLAADAPAGDCFNDDLPERSDLEPPVPGRDADLLRISDEDLERMLEATRAYERRHGATRHDQAAPASARR